MLIVGGEGFSANFESLNVWREVALAGRYWNVCSRHDFFMKTAWNTLMK